MRLKKKGKLRLLIKSKGLIQQKIYLSLVDLSAFVETGYIPVRGSPKNFASRV